MNTSPSMPNTEANPDIVHVAVGVVVDDSHRVLIAERPADKDFPGHWEFPGGKVHLGETTLEALKREMHEELGVEVKAARPLITVEHEYEHKHVVLHTWLVEHFTGIVAGREGQVISWQPLRQLDAQRFPSANVPIIEALQLPSRYIITPEPGAMPQFLDQLLQVTQRYDAPLICLRAKTLARLDYERLLEAVLKHLPRQCRLMIHGHAELVSAWPVEGLHLTSQQLKLGQNHHLPEGKRLAASCHDPDDLATAGRCGVNFAVLSPVNKPIAHDSAHPPLGWDVFHHWVSKAGFPVYALGGLSEDDLATSWQYGAQGVAGISAFWPR